MKKINDKDDYILIQHCNGEKYSTGIMRHCTMKEMEVELDNFQSNHGYKGSIARVDFL